MESIQHVLESANLLTDTGRPTRKGKRVTLLAVALSGSHIIRKVARHFTPTQQGPVHFDTSTTFLLKLLHRQARFSFSSIFVIHCAESGLLSMPTSLYTERWRAGQVPRLWPTHR